MVMRFSLSIAAGRSRDQVLREIRDSLAGDLFHDLLELALEHGNGMRATVGAECADAVHEGAAEEGELGAARKGAGDVRAGANAAVDHHGGAMAELFGELAERLDGGLA